MSKTGQSDGNGYNISDPAEFARNMTKVAEQTAKIFSAFTNPEDAAQSQQSRSEDFEKLAKTFGDIAQGYMNNPQRFLESQMQLWQQHSELWQSTWRRMLGEDVEPVIEPGRGDRRFRDKEWEENQVFDFLKQSYLITSKWAQDMVDDADDVDEHTRKKANFYVEQIANALSPSNFVLTNPAVLRATMESNAENLVKGMENFSGDFDPETGELRISQTDASAFEVGVNIAVTPGKVVFQNDMFQLLQYEPTTKKVHQTPLVIVPPWINKFYILDLNEEKSFIKWAVAQGFTVFIVSWVNPDEKLAAKTFADYMHEGILTAVDAAMRATGEPKVNAIGYCIGGTLLASTLGYMAAKGDERVNSATFFTTQVDFEHAGDLMVFVDEEQLQSLERKMAEKGFLEGRKMASTFNFLRSNDLIWSYVVNNYLNGQGPVPVRPALLELRFDPPAGGHAQLLSARVLSEQQSVPGQNGSGRCPDRPLQGQGAGLQSGDPGRPHRAPALDLQGRQVSRRQDAARGRGLRPCRRRGQPARARQISILDQHQERRHDRGLARRRQGASGLMVAALGQVAGKAVRREDRCPRARQGQAQGDRGRAGVLRQEPAERQGPEAQRQVGR